MQAQTHYVVHAHRHRDDERSDIDAPRFPGVHPLVVLLRSAFYALALVLTLAYPHEPGRTTSRLAHCFTLEWRLYPPSSILSAPCYLLVRRDMARHLAKCIRLPIFSISHTQRLDTTMDTRTSPHHFEAHRGRAPGALHPSGFDASAPRTARCLPSHRHLLPHPGHQPSRFRFQFRTRNHPSSPRACIPPAPAPIPTLLASASPY
ncbi:hypothetical protein DENSPDRAFT_504140 [Dentipellis sp. KUC8613]|nr:hypothetical protein DENSPDRAFT_504140 [Dentipellis sp. KUC8613]